MDEHVAIIGGGIGGLTAAAALARRGIPVTVHERAPEVREIGTGVSLWPAPLKVFDRLGIGDEVRALGGSWEHAWVLAEELARSTDVAEALRAYERRRRWRAGAVTMIARAATAGTRSEGRMAVAARSRVAALAPPALALRQLELITRGP